MNSKVTIAGGGLVGSLLAIFLARRGFSVEVFERRPDMRKEKIGAGRSINLAISTRGIHALKTIGLDKKVLEEAVPMKARMIHSKDGKQTPQPYGKDDTQYINSISRADLNKILMTEAERTGHVRFLFKRRLKSVEKSELVLVNEESGEEERHGFETLFGTDGAGSAVREHLLRSKILEETETSEDYGYKELSMPPAANGGFRLEMNALHIWPRKTFMLIALPNIDGSFTCTLFLPYKGQVSFETLSSNEAVTSFFKEHFADAVPHLCNLHKEFFENPTGRLATVRSNPWHDAGKIVLLGDAAHAIVPFFGQGMNCGFEDVTVLDELIETHGTNWEKIFPNFSALRKPNADAIAHMAVENFYEMRDKVGQESFLLRKQVERTLEAKFPSLFIPRYSLVTFHRVPYGVAEEAGCIQDEILNTLCNTLTRVEDLDFQYAEVLVQQKLARFMEGIRFS